jgi:hypothetical protein
MRYSKTLSMSLMLLIVIALLASCGGNKGGGLEGRYVKENSRSYLEFHSDGWLEMSTGRQNVIPVTGTYKLNGDNVEIFVEDVGPLPVKPGEPVMVFTRSGEDLISTKGAAKWVKQKDGDSSETAPGSDL